MPTSYDVVGIGDVGQSSYDAQRCSRCGARIPPGADWCTLCYAPREPSPGPPDAAPLEVLSAAAKADASPEDEASAEAEAEAEAEASGEASAEAEAAAEAAAEAMIQLLAAQSPAPLGRWSGRLESAQVRIAIMVGGVVVVAAVLVEVMALLGAVFSRGG